MPRTSWEALLPYLLIPILIYLALLVLLYLSQTRLLYLPNLPSRALERTPADLGLMYHSVYLETEDGIKLHAWFVPVAMPRATLLLCHGNAGNISHRLETLALFHRLGLAVLIFDYRGYGLSEGQPSEGGTYLDAEAAWRYLRETLQIPADRIILFGRSLGGAVAAQLAAHHRAAGLILESTFTSVPELAALLYPLFPARWLSRFRYDTRNALGEIDYPVMIIHSRDDEVIPFEQSERLFEAASPPKRFLALSGGHNEGFLRSGDRYIEALDSFISSLTKRKDG